MTTVIIPPEGDNGYLLPPRRLREFHALKATALDAARFPILARHWPGFLVIDGALAVNDDSPAFRLREVHHEQA